MKDIYPFILNKRQKELLDADTLRHTFTLKREGTRMRKLFLDDIRQAPDSTWDVVRSYDAFVGWVKEHGVPDVVAFDHDLADEHYPLLEAEPVGKEIPYTSYKIGTGYHAADWLLQCGKLPRLVVVHSFNPVGAKNIAGLFKGRCAVEVAPYNSGAFNRIMYQLRNLN